MSSRTTRALALIVAAAVCIAALSAVPAAAVPLEQEVTANRVALERALERYAAAQAAASEIDARMQGLSAELDGIIAEEALYQQQLQTRVVAMYRSGSTNTLSLLLGASSIQDLAIRLDFLDRLARHDAESIQALKAARAEAKRSAEGLIEVQTEQARALEGLAEEVAAARKELAASEATLKEYEDRVAAAARAAAAKQAATQKITGTGEWKTAVASHYSATFTGRGASGEEIGPYSMMVAHKTLPFGTLIEFEYNGKRAVAHVADRGPYVPGREFDLGPGVVRVLGFNGVHEVRYRIID